MIARPPHMFRPFRSTGTYTLGRTSGIWPLKNDIFARTRCGNSAAMPHTGSMYVDSTVNGPGPQQNTLLLLVGDEYNFISVSAFIFCFPSAYMADNPGQSCRDVRGINAIKAAFTVAVTLSRVYFVVIIVASAFDSTSDRIRASSLLSTAI